jgi:hypothetical protein
MLYREIITVCSQIYPNHINTLCGQNVELLNVKLAVHIVTTGLQRVNIVCAYHKTATRPRHVSTLVMVIITT